MRFRLRRKPPLPPAPPGPGPVIFVLPARDEEESVGDIVARIPNEVDGHRPVIPVVVDDGSTDGTARAAKTAGAEVVSTPGLGLGAAVRHGFEYAVRRGAAAVVFCDADGEYAPEELERMVQPILAGRAEYVVGSRFLGEIHRMRLHRRLGNRLLTYGVSWVARMPITDGQSGYRALSSNAADSAEIAHDYNYAQVLTLDLLAKGFRYAEVPISYSFRRSGKSYIRPVRYLRHVVPTVWRQLNRPVPSAAADAPPAVPAR